MIVDHISNWRRYGFGPAWEQMMCWLENYAPGGSGSLAGLKDGTHPLADGFVNVATLTSRPLSGSLYECHKRFCDVQMVVEGQEWLFNAATTGLTLNGAFDDQRDIGFFQPARRKSAGSRLRPALLPSSFRGTRTFRPSRWTGYPPHCASAWAKSPLRRCAFPKGFRHGMTAALSPQEGEDIGFPSRFSAGRALTEALDRLSLWNAKK